jgi:hypothetical protein
MDIYYEKYLKYKNKYLELKKIVGGSKNKRKSRKTKEISLDEFKIKTKKDFPDNLKIFAAKDNTDFPNINVYNILNKLDKKKSLEDNMKYLNENENKQIEDYIVGLYNNDKKNKFKYKIRNLYPIYLRNFANPYSKNKQLPNHAVYNILLSFDNDQTIDYNLTYNSTSKYNIGLINKYIDELYVYLSKK